MCWNEHGVLAKTRAGKGAVPIGSALRRELVALKLRTGRDGDALAFGNDCHAAV
jgi:hypothetical protein